MILLRLTMTQALEEVDRMLVRRVRKAKLKFEMVSQKNRTLNLDRRRQRYKGLAEET